MMVKQLRAKAKQPSLALMETNSPKRQDKKTESEMLCCKTMLKRYKAVNKMVNEPIETVFSYNVGNRHSLW